MGWVRLAGGSSAAVATTAISSAAPWAAPVDDLAAARKPLLGRPSQTGARVSGDWPSVTL